MYGTLCEVRLGILSEKYRFSLNGQKWCVDMLFRFKGYRYRLFIDEEVIFDRSLIQNTEDMVTKTTLLFTHKGEDYALHIAPSSYWSYGLHLYQGGRLVYRHKNREFVALPRLTRFAQRADKIKGYDDRPFWKHLLEGGLIGAIVGVTGGLGTRFAKDAGWIPELDYLPWIVATSVLVALLKPSKYRLIR
jgi:hypothetical protein